jgi:hypothetical protein
MDLKYDICTIKDVCTLRNILFFYYYLYVDRDVMAFAGEAQVVGHAQGVA